MMNEFTPTTQTRYTVEDHTLSMLTVASVVVFPALTFLTLFIALGSALGSTPESRVPWAANAAWFISGYAFAPALILLVFLWTTKHPMVAKLLGGLLVLAIVAFFAGTLINMIF